MPLHNQRSHFLVVRIGHTQSTPALTRSSAQVATMDIAINHNNEGILLLERGMHERALSEFKAAAQLMYNITQEFKNRRLNGEDANARFESLTICSQSENPVVTGNSFIRSNPILMSCSQEPNGAVHCTIESATILLNMALTYHIDSQNPNCMKDALQNAIMLYDMAYSLGLQVHKDSRTNQIILTALNNLGLIYYEQGDYSKSTLYMEDLSTFLTFLSSEGEAENTNDLQEYILNALVLRNPNRSAGAA